MPSPRHWQNCPVKQSIKLPIRQSLLNRPGLPHCSIQRFKGGPDLEARLGGMGQMGSLVVAQFQSRSSQSILASIAFLVKSRQYHVLVLRLRLPSQVLDRRGSNRQLGLL